MWATRRYIFKTGQGTHYPSCARANFARQSQKSHSVVVRAAPALRWNPGDDLVGVHDVAGFAMHAVRRIEVDALLPRCLGRFLHLIHIGRAEELARIPVLPGAAVAADIRVLNNEVRRLIFLVPRGGVIQVGELVKSQLAIALGWAE